MAVKFGLAIGAQIAPRSIFARKNYFYPDLPKGYQISQYEQPVVGKGAITSCSTTARSRRVGVTRAHLEEDAGKSLHEGLPNASGIDLNRAGTPLLEIVSEPDMRSAKEAVAYMKKIHTLVRYLEICDGNMQEGSFRCDANVSVRQHGAAKFGTRAEIKNLNSFRFVEKAIQYEVARQIEIIESGGKVVQETRLYDSDKNETRSMRSKEEANDYRYFPDPDLLPLEIDEQFIDAVRGTLRSCRTRRPRASRAISGCPPTMPASCRRAASSAPTSRRWSRPVSRMRNSRRIGSWASCRARSIATTWKSTPRESRRGLGWAAYAHRRCDDFRQDRQGGVRGDVVRRQRCRCNHRGQGSRTDHRRRRDRAVIDAVIAANPKQLADFRAGKDKLFGFFVGQVMKATAARRTPRSSTSCSRRKLGGSSGFLRMRDRDCLHRFMFEGYPIRGQLVHLDASWRALIEHREYPRAIRDTLGEAVAASLLLAGTIKFDGVLSLQLQGEGPVQLLLAQCTSGLGVRGLARYREPATCRRRCERRRRARRAGNLTVTLETDDMTRRYQGIVPITGERLAESLRIYFENSEQLPTRLWLHADALGASGMLLQRLPSEGGERGVDAAAADAAAIDDAWRRVQLIGETLTPEELVTLADTEILHRLFNEDDLRLFEPAPVYFRCRCSRERVGGMLQGLGEAETRSVLAERGEVEVRCDFCNRAYVFDAVDVAQLFNAGVASDGGSSVH